MPSLAEFQAELDQTFATMKILRADPEATATIGGRTYTQKNLGELERHYDWLQGAIANLQQAAASAAGGGAGVAEFGRPSA
jgi:hypothetical protein